MRIIPTTLASHSLPKRICSSSQRSSHSGSGRCDCTVSFGNIAWFTCRFVGCSAFLLRAELAMSMPMRAKAARASSPKRSIMRRMYWR